MARKQLGLSPSGDPDAATKAYVDEQDSLYYGSLAYAIAFQVNNLNTTAETPRLFIPSLAGVANSPVASGAAYVSTVYTDDLAYIVQTLHPLGDPVPWTRTCVSGVWTDWVQLERSGQPNPALPIGTVIEWFAATLPTGFIELDGVARSRTTYAELFALWGTTFGVGDGSTTFGIPNTKGRSLVGQDSSQTEFDTLGETGGAKTHTLTVNEMPTHNHAPAAGPSYARAGAATGWTSIGIASGAAYTFSYAGDTNMNNGGGQPHNNLQPYVVGRYIVKALYTSAENPTSAAHAHAIEDVTDLGTTIEGLKTAYIFTDMVLWDLNYVQQRPYYVNDAAFLSHCPVVSGRVLVEAVQSDDGTLCVQRLTHMSSGAVWTRTYYSSEWTGWQAVGTGLPAAQARGSLSVESGAMVNDAVIANVAFGAVPLKTRVDWNANGHAGYGNVAGTLYLWPTVSGATVLSSSAPQPMSVGAGGSATAWISVAEGGAFEVPANTAVTLVLTAKIAGASHEYWRMNIDWRRTFQP